MPLKNETPDPRMDEMRQGFIEDCGDLWDKNQERFMALLNSSDAKAVKLTFTATIDFSESEAGMDVEIGYGQRFKDKRKRTFGDPDQAELPIGQRPGTGLPETNGNGVPEGASEADTPEGYRIRHPEEFAGTDDSGANGKAPKKRGRKKKSEAVNQ